MTRFLIALVGLSAIAFAVPASAQTFVICAGESLELSTGKCGQYDLFLHCTGLNAAESNLQAIAQSKARALAMLNASAASRCKAMGGAGGKPNITKLNEVEVGGNSCGYTTYKIQCQ